MDLIRKHFNVRRILCILVCMASKHTDILKKKKKR